MRIQETRPATAAEKKKKIQQAADGSAFADALSSAESPQSAASVAAPVSIAPMNAMLAAQMQPDDMPALKERVQYGRDMLEELQYLQQNLLSGAVSASQVKQLAALVREHKDPTSDPRLEAILDEIELRAEVELAKLGL